MAAEAKKVETSLLLCGAGNRVCGLPLEHVLETMRPLPLETIPRMPSFILGLSVVRGAPLPVVDLATLLGQERRASTRFITIRTGKRRIALAVASVLGIRELDGASLARLPPLLQSASAEFVTAIGALDSQLLVILETGRIVSDDAWTALSVRSEPA